MKKLIPYSLVLCLLGSASTLHAQVMAPQPGPVDAPGAPAALQMVLPPSAEPEPAAQPTGPVPAPSQPMQVAPPPGPAPSLPSPPSPLRAPRGTRRLPQERLAAPPARTPYGATPTLLDVAVSDSSTTYLVFPGAVSLVDVGMLDNYLVKIENNSVFVRARKKATPPTPVMVRYGTKYWMGRLVTVQRPVLMLYDFSKPGALTPPAEPAQLTPAQLLGPDAIAGPELEGVEAEDVAGSNQPGIQTATGAPLVTKSPGVGPDNELALDRTASAKDRLNARLRLLSYEPTRVHSVASVDNRLTFALVNVRNDHQFSYLRFKLDNHSSIDYQVDFADFTLIENDKKRFLGKKRNEARRPMVATAGRANQRIPANSTGYLYYAVPLYAATNQGHLAVGLRELSGARAIALNIPSVVINTAPTFKAPLQ